MKGGKAGGTGWPEESWKRGENGEGRELWNGTIFQNTSMWREVESTGSRAKLAKSKN